MRHSNEEVIELLLFAYRFE